VIEFVPYFSGSSGNIYTCSDGETTILIEIGVPFPVVRKALNFKTSGVAGALVSHSHKDHCKGVPEAARNGIDCYMPEESISELCLSGHRIKAVKPFAKFRVGSFSILPFPLHHDVVNFGFLIQSDNGGKMVYCTDTRYIKYRFKGVNVFAIECNYDAQILEKNIESGFTSSAIKSRLEKSHFEFSRVKEFFRVQDTSRTREIHLIHVSRGNGDPAMFRDEIEKITGVPVYVKGD
jgi:phosphoribosyl 1,2-cyclic phosphodiesterase